MAIATLLVSPTTVLTKKFIFDKENKEYKVEPYPNVFEVTSVEKEYHTIEELEVILNAGARANYCLLKGRLDRPLQSESRAGHTDRNANTQLLIFDYDHETGFNSPDELLRTLDPGLENVSYIWQRSASAGIKHQSEIRGHAFVLLEKPVNPASIKEWILKLNLTIPELRSRIRLSKTGMGLCYPLDVTVNQNDKLIYIANPQCVGFDDPIENRIRLIKKTESKFLLGPESNAQKNKEQAQALLTELQKANGLEPRNPKFGMYGEEEILLNPSICAVTGVWDRGKYVSINLNDGDSWGYWYYKDNPEILHNFKGEAATYLRDISPGYYASLVKPRAGQGNKAYVFIDKHSDKYHTALINVERNEIIELIPRSSKEKLFDFLAHYGRPKPPYIEDWSIEFKPQELKRLDIENKWINSFERTKYMNNIQDVKEVPPTINKVIKHLCGNQEVYDHFINWLAFVFQRKEKAQTAWLFPGVEGTGKGTLYHQILKPIFGQSGIYQDYKGLDDTFNDQFEKAILVFMDEGDSGNAVKPEAAMAKMRALITEPTLDIRVMYKGWTNKPSYCNVIMATNEIKPIILRESDRRWNIAPRQKTKIVFEEGEFDQIPRELEAFAGYLNNFKYNENQVRQSLKNEAREELIDLCRSNAESFAKAIKEGDLDFFAEFLMEKPPIPSNGYFEYESIVKKWSNKINQEQFVSQEDLRTVYNFLGNKNLNPKAFGFVLKNVDIQMDRIRVEGIKTRGIKLTFHGEEVEIPDRPVAGVIEINKGKKHG